LNNTKSAHLDVVTAPRMKIAELERASGTGRSTVHHYLNLGLLPAPERRGPKLHLFRGEHLQRLREIKRLKSRGLSLSQIRLRLSSSIDAVSRPSRAPAPAPLLPTRNGPSGAARGRILDTAARLFTERGYENVRVSSIARAAGVGKATLYEYYKSKSDLFVACLDRLIEDMIAAQSQYIAREGSSLLTDVERYAAAVIASYPSYRMMISALGAAAFGKDPKVAERARAGFMRLVTIFEPTLRKAIADGRCRQMDSEMLSYMAWGALIAVGARVHHGDRRYTLLDGMHQYVDFMTRGVAPLGARRQDR
jgi:AcrR family transcriptional regulator